MPRQDVFGPQIQGVIQGANEPITAAVIAEQVGCSIQRVHKELKELREARRVKVAGRGATGAYLYQWRTDADVGHGGDGGGDGAGVDGRSAGGRVGAGVGALVFYLDQQLVVSGVRKVDGVVEVEVEDDAGRRVTLSSSNG